MNRRSFFGVFAGGSAVTATLIRQPPPKLQAHNLSETGTVQVPIRVRPEHLGEFDLRDIDLHEELLKLTERVHYRLENTLCPHLERLRVSTKMELAQAGDTVAVGLLRPDGTWESRTQVQLTHHLEATALLPDLYGLMKTPGLMGMDGPLYACQFALHERIVELITGKNWMACRALPNIIPGLGVVSARAIGSKVILRSIFGYNPETLGHIITFDVLLGAA